MLIPIRSSSTACLMPVCNHFHARCARVPLFDALVREVPPHPGARNFVTKN